MPPPDSSTAPSRSTCNPTASRQQCPPPLRKLAPPAAAPLAARPVAGAAQTPRQTIKPAPAPRLQYHNQQHQQIKRLSPPVARTLLPIKPSVMPLACKPQQQQQPAAPRTQSSAVLCKQPSAPSSSASTPRSSMSPPPSKPIAISLKQAPPAVSIPPANSIAKHTQTPLQQATTTQQQQHLPHQQAPPLTVPMISTSKKWVLPPRPKPGRKPCSGGSASGSSSGGSSASSAKRRASAAATATSSKNTSEKLPPASRRALAKSKEKAAASNGKVSADAPPTVAKKVQPRLTKQQQQQVKPAVSFVEPTKLRPSAAVDGSFPLSITEDFTRIKVEEDDDNGDANSDETNAVLSLVNEIVRDAAGGENAGGLLREDNDVVDVNVDIEMDIIGLPPQDNDGLLAAAGAGFSGMLLGRHHPKAAAPHAAAPHAAPPDSAARPPHNGNISRSASSIMSAAPFDLMFSPATTAATATTATTSASPAPSSASSASVSLASPPSSSAASTNPSSPFFALRLPQKSSSPLDQQVALTSALAPTQAASQDPKAFEISCLRMALESTNLENQMLHVIIDELRQEVASLKGTALCSGSAPQQIKMEDGASAQIKVEESTAKPKRRSARKGKPVEDTAANSTSAMLDKQQQLQQIASLKTASANMMQALASLKTRPAAPPTTAPTSAPLLSPSSSSSLAYKPNDQFNDTSTYPQLPNDPSTNDFNDSLILPFYFSNTAAGVSPAAPLPAIGTTSKHTPQFTFSLFDDEEDDDMDDDDYDDDEEKIKLRVQQRMMAMEEEAAARSAQGLLGPPSPGASSPGRRKSGTRFKRCCSTTSLRSLLTARSSNTPVPAVPSSTASATPAAAARAAAAGVSATESPKTEAWSRSSNLHKKFKKLSADEDDAALSSPPSSSSSSNSAVSSATTTPDETGFLAAAKHPEDVFLTSPLRVSGSEMGVTPGALPVCMPMSVPGLAAAAAVSTVEAAATFYTKLTAAASTSASPPSLSSSVSSAMSCSIAPLDSPAAAPATDLPAVVAIADNDDDGSASPTLRRAGTVPGSVVAPLNLLSFVGADAKRDDVDVDELKALFYATPLDAKPRPLLPASSASSKLIASWKAKTLKQHAGSSSPQKQPPAPLPAPQYRLGAVGPPIDPCGFCSNGTPCICAEAAAAAAAATAAALLSSACPSPAALSSSSSSSSSCAAESSGLASFSKMTVDAAACVPGKTGGARRSSRSNCRRDGGASGDGTAPTGLGAPGARPGPQAAASAAQTAPADPDGDIDMLGAGARGPTTAAAKSTAVLVVDVDQILAVDSFIKSEFADDD